jgi:hypothetical protein
MLTYFVISRPNEQIILYFQPDILQLGNIITLIQKNVFNSTEYFLPVINLLLIKFAATLDWLLKRYQQLTIM